MDQFFQMKSFRVHHKETGLNPDIWIKNVGLAFLFIYKYLIESGIPITNEHVERCIL